MIPGRLRDMLPVVLPGAAAALYGWAVFISTFDHPGSIGINYIAPGTDWMVLYGAVKLAILHNFSLLLDGPAFTAYLNSSFAHWLSQPCSIALGSIHQVSWFCCSRSADWV